MPGDDKVLDGQLKNMARILTYASLLSISPFHYSYIEFLRIIIMLMEEDMKEEEEMGYVMLLYQFS